MLDAKKKREKTEFPLKWVEPQMSNKWAKVAIGFIENKETTISLCNFIEYWAYLHCRVFVSIDNIGKLVDIFSVVL